MKGAIAVLLLAVLQSTMTNAATDPKTYFPNLKNNLTTIVWTHAVNSLNELNEALEDTTVMMLEADVVMGTKTNNNNNATKLPIMAHPPANTSDLSLEEFVEKVNKKNRTVGVKLDFKSIEAFTASNKILKSLNDNATYPVFINADIYAGPVQADPPAISPNVFVAEAKKYGKLVLSLGWTTKLEGDKNSTQKTGYTMDQVNKMIEMLKAQNVSQPITYAVRANLAAASPKEMEKLVNNTEVKNTTLTIWSHDTDAVNASSLSSLIAKINVQNVYLDVPKALKSQLNLNITDKSGASGITVTMMTLLGSLFVNFLLTSMPLRG